MSTQQQIALEQPPIVLFKKPVWDNPTSRRNEPYWTCETIFGTASIHQKSDGSWRLRGDFISRIPDDDEEYKGFGINTIDQSRVYDNQDPDVLKTVIDNLHITQLEKFLDLISSVNVPSDIDSVKKESGLVKFNCNLKYSSKDCDYTTTFNTSKNPPHQVVIDVIEHLGWMAALDGDAKPAIAALYQGIERGGARAIELTSIRTPKTEVHTDELAVVDSTESLVLLGGLAAHVREAIRIGLEAAEKSDDGGSANLDQVILTNLENFPLQALLDHDLPACETHHKGQYALTEWFGGQGNKRAVGVSATSKYLTKVGVAHYVHYQLD